MTGTGRRITTEEVTLKTASVEIRTLTINGKQMTLAVFRQLINDGSVIDDEVLELRGDPWGIVNYCTTKECATSFGHHLHVIWQDGGELRRSQEYPLSSEIKPVGYRRRRYDELNDLAQKWATAATIEDWTPSRWEKLKPCIPFSQKDRKSVV